MEEGDFKHIVIDKLRFRAELCDLSKLESCTIRGWGVQLTLGGCLDGDVFSAIRFNEKQDTRIIASLRAKPGYIEDFIEEYCKRVETEKNPAYQGLTTLRLDNDVLVIRSKDAWDRLDKDIMFQKVVRFLEDVDTALGKIHSSESKPGYSAGIGGRVGIKNSGLLNMDPESQEGWREKFKGSIGSTKNNGWEKF